MEAVYQISRFYRKMHDSMYSVPKSALLSDQTSGDNNATSKYTTSEPFTTKTTACPVCASGEGQQSRTDSCTAIGGGLGALAVISHTFINCMQSQNLENGTWGHTPSQPAVTSAPNT